MKIMEVMKIDINEKVRQLSNIRVQLASLQETLDKKKAEFEDTNSQLITTISDCKTFIVDTTDSIRKAAVAEFEASDKSNKKMYPGVTIQATKVFNYDPEKAMAWARDHKLCIIPESLDVKAFEAQCKSKNPPECVTIDDAYKTVIDTDLSKVLGGE
jgi:hypothetical protein